MEDEQEKDLKVIKTYSKEVPYIYKEGEGDADKKNPTENNKGNLGISLSSSTSFREHVNSPDNTNDNLGISISSSGFEQGNSENNAEDNLGVSLADLSYRSALTTLSVEPSSSTSHLHIPSIPLFDGEVLEDPYNFDLFVEDESPSPLCVPIFSSTPKKAIRPEHASDREEDMSCESLNLTTSTIESDVTNSNIHVDTDELTACIATPKIHSKASPEGRSSTILLSKYTKPQSIHGAMRLSCCDKKCLEMFSYTDIKNSRTLFWSKSVQHQNTYVLEKFRCGRKTNGKWSFFEVGKKICAKAFKGLFNINKNRFNTLKKKFNEGHISCEPNNRLRSVKYLEAMSWLENYAFFRADDSPDSSKKLLPYKTRKISVYRNYVDERREMNTAKIKKSTFFKMWKTDFPDLRIKEVNSFSRCTKCTSIGRQLEKTSLSISRKKALLLARNEHNHRQMMERQYYYKKREAAKRAPAKFLSIIVDGMDQSKSNLPHFVGRTAKAVNSADQLKTHISGVIAHGQNEFFTFLDIGQYPHDSNLTINIILQILFKIKDMMGGKLPPTLYLQADNCWRENKNKFVLAFCEYLVHENIFKEVHLSFLMVGHTHEDIDACFSKVADKLRRNDAETLDDLIELLPNVTTINFIYDVRTWIQNSICDLRKHTRPLHYKFKSNESIVETFYKGKHNSPWKKLEGGILARNSHQKIISIRGSPKLSPINFEGIGLERISSHLNHWKCLFSDQIDHTQFLWWKRFLQFWKKCEENSSERHRQFFTNAQWILPKLPKQSTHDDNEEENVLPDTIQDMMNDELIEPVVLSK